MGLLACALGAGAVGGHAAAEPVGPPVAATRVRFGTTCGPAATQAIDRAMTSFFVGDPVAAARGFRDVAAAEPRCAMASWGVALTAYQPLEQLPTRAEIAAGRDAIGRALRIGTSSARERDYLAALSTFYDADVDLRMRYFWREKGFQELAERYPHDRTAAKLYALSAIEAAVVTGEKALDRRRHAAEALRRVLAEDPADAGAATLFLEASATPELAKSALGVAKRLGELSAHTPRAELAAAAVFTSSDEPGPALEAARAALAAAPHGDVVSAAELEALDRVVEADLVLGDRAGAERVVLGVPALAPLEASPAAAAALASIPARWVAAQRDFARAAGLTLAPASYPWSRYPLAEAPVLLVRAMGAARLGDASRAHAAADALDALRDRMGAELREPSALYLDAYADAAAAWASLADGQRDDALARMRSALGEENAAAARALGRVPVVSARVQLRDMIAAAPPEPIGARTP
jgi:hypothetical protein